MVKKQLISKLTDLIKTFSLFSQQKKEEHESIVNNLSKLDEILRLILWKKHYGEIRQLLACAFLAVVKYDKANTTMDAENRAKLLEHFYQLCLNTLNPEFDLDKYLDTLNLFTRYGELEYTTAAHSVDFDENDWLQKIRMCFDIGIEKTLNRHSTSNDQSMLFKRLTSASLLFLSIETKLCIDSMSQAEYSESTASSSEATIRFLEKAPGFSETFEFLRGCAKLCDEYKAAFDLLQMFISSLNKANEFEKAMQTIVQKLT